MDDPESSRFSARSMLFAGGGVVVAVGLGSALYFGVTPSPTPEPAPTATASSVKPPVGAPSPAESGAAKPPVQIAAASPTPAAVVAPVAGAVAAPPPPVVAPSSAPAATPPPLAAPVAETAISPPTASPAPPDAPIAVASASLPEDKALSDLNVKNSSAPEERRPSGGAAKGRKNTAADARNVEPAAEPIQEYIPPPQSGGMVEVSMRSPRSRDLPRIQEELRRAMGAKDERTVNKLFTELEKSKGAETPYLLKMRSYWLISQGNPQAAEELLQRVLMRDPDDVEAQTNMALVEMHTGRREAARQRVFSQLTRHPNHPQLRELSNQLR
ncbi:MAG: tetratricopeptide repeat protein [Magnetococcales bacterium]|nr:tetratricopeptide repeat protein [Magnetococcales bacterium]